MRAPHLLLFAALGLAPAVGYAETSTASTALSRTAPAPSGDGLFLGPYARLSGIVARDAGFGFTSPIGALVRFDAGVEVAPFSADRGLAFELGLSAGISGATRYGAIETQLAMTSIQAAVLYRQPVLPYFVAYGRAIGAVNWGHLRLAEDYLETEIDQVARSVSGGGALGLEASIPLEYTPNDGQARGAANYIGFFVEFGYEVHGDLRFDGARRDVDLDADPAPIAQVGQDLGTLNLTGWTWRLGGSFRF